LTPGCDASYAEINGATVEESSQRPHHVICPEEAVFEPINLKTKKTRSKRITAAPINIKILGKRLFGKGGIIGCAAGV
jgi:hypothetical protein